VGIGWGGADVQLSLVRSGAIPASDRAHGVVHCPCYLTGLCFVLRIAA